MRVTEACNEIIGKELKGLEEERKNVKEEIRGLKERIKEYEERMSGIKVRVEEVERWIRKREEEEQSEKRGSNRGKGVRNVLIV